MLVVLTRDLEMNDQMEQQLYDFQAGLDTAYQALREHPEWRGSTADPHGHLFGKDDDDLRWFMDLSPRLALEAITPARPE
jgi:hypothetical protein